MQTQSVQVVLLLLVCIILGPCYTQQVGAETRPAQPEGLLSGLGRLVQSFALDVGTHTAHLLLNGLPPGDLATSKPAGEAPSMRFWQDTSTWAGLCNSTAHFSFTQCSVGPTAALILYC